MAEKTPAEIELEDSIRSIRGVGENAAGQQADGANASESDAGLTVAEGDSSGDPTPPIVSRDSQ